MKDIKKCFESFNGAEGSAFDIIFMIQSILIIAPIGDASQIINSHLISCSVLFLLSRQSSAALRRSEFFLRQLPAPLKILTLLLRE